MSADIAPYAMPRLLTIETALTAGAKTLAGHDAAALEAEVLLAHVLDKPRAHLYTWPEQLLDAAQQQRFLHAIALRAVGEPIAYLTGHREFWSLDLQVSRHTLIPRHETELLVELALARIPTGAALRIADLGTGSGAIALAIAAERPTCRIVATDISPEALELAGANAERLSLRNVECRRGDWLAALPAERFDLIVSNPPYLAEGDPHLSQGDLPAEPRGALVAGPSGLEMLAILISGSAAHLTHQGWLLLEHGYDQAAAVAELLGSAGFAAVRTWCDAAGMERVTGGQR